MEDDLKLFDLTWRQFMSGVFQMGGVMHWEDPGEMTLSEARGVLVSLAYMVWVLGQRVKKLEKEE